MIPTTRKCRREGCTKTVEIRAGKGLGKAPIFCSSACYPTRRWERRNQNKLAIFIRQLKIELKKLPAWYDVGEEQMVIELSKVYEALENTIKQTRGDNGA